MYRVHERNAHVMAIIDSRRNVEDILLEKLIKIQKWGITSGVSCRQGANGMVATDPCVSQQILA